MSHSKDAEKSYEFKWGKKKGVGGAKKNIQFYESFAYDDVEYFLYDCVYLYKEDEPEPYIGKLVKIWEWPNHEKAVKVVWFFRPIELLNHLGDDAPLKNEIFLASGEGVGLANVNPLEVLAGKCNVVCTSKDKRNPQPTELEVERAEYIFYRTFDVRTLTISEKIEDKIAGIEARCFLNREVCQKLIAVPKLKENWKGVELKKTTANGEEQRRFSGEKTIPMPKTSFDKDGVKAGKIPISQVEDKVKLKSVEDLYRFGALENSSFKKNRLLGDSAKPSEELEPNVSPTLVLGKESNANIVQRLMFGTDEDGGKSSRPPVKTSKYKTKTGTVKYFVGLDRELSKKVNLGEKATKLSDKAASELAREKGIKTAGQVLDVTRRPDVDRSKWFKQLPWEERMQRAHEKGALVLLQNLDPSYTSADVEDIIYQAFREKCTAKVIQRSTFSSPHCGEAFVIFKSGEVAEMAVTKLDRDCLMLENGRPLVACKGTPRVPGKPTKFVGHLSIEKINLQKQRDQMRDAVSTSHYPQPNTIEFEMAMEWCLLHKQSDLWWEALYEEQGKELDALMGQLKHH